MKLVFELLCVYKVSVLIRFQHVYVSSHDCSHVNEIKRDKINESFRASEKSLTTNDNSLEISLAQLPSAMKFRSKYRSVRRNIVVTQTIGLPKYHRNIAPNESSLIFVEYSRNSSNFVCITFAQYCNIPLLNKIRKNRCLSISVVKNTTINNLDIRTFVVINREKLYFLVINCETRQLRLLIVNFTVNNRTIYDY